MRRITLGLIFAVFLFSQQNGRFASLKSQAFDLFDRGRYSEVAGRLEEVWEQDHSDARVAEYLAMGYLYGEKDVKKAKALMQESLKAGGLATFLVQHSHERGLGLLGSDVMNNYCSGRISVAPGKMSFIADSGDHSATFAAADLKEFRLPGNKPGRAEIKSGAKAFIFRVKSDTHAEAALFEDLVNQNLRSK